MITSKVARIQLATEMPQPAINALLDQSAIVAIGKGHGAIALPL